MHLTVIREIKSVRLIRLGCQPELLEGTIRAQDFLWGFVELYSFHSDDHLLCAKYHCDEIERSYTIYIDHNEESERLFSKVHGG